MGSKEMYFTGCLSLSSLSTGIALGFIQFLYRLPQFSDIMILPRDGYHLLLKQWFRMSSSYFELLRQLLTLILLSVA
jgi:hypothetical protein